VPGDASGDESYIISAINTGDAATTGAITLSDHLPLNIEALQVEGVDPSDLENQATGEPMSCELAPTPRCMYEKPVVPGGELRMKISVAIHAPEGTTSPNVATVAGGGVPGSVGTNAVGTTVSTTPASFGFEGFAAALSSYAAGAHPDVTTSFTLNQSLVNVGEGHQHDEPAQTLKEANVELPPGLVGNPTATPRCTALEVEQSTCPSTAVVGMALVTLSFNGTPEVFPELVYSILPYTNEPAAFMMDPAGIPVRLDASVRSNSDYGINISARDVSEVQPALSAIVTFWGVPSRFNGPGGDRTLNGRSFGGPGGGAHGPFTESPTQCAMPLSWRLAGDSWLGSDSVGGGQGPPADATFESPVLTGCGAMSFAPTLTVRPETFQVDEPSGYEVDLRVPQNESPDGPATPEVKNVSITLPAGVAVSPSAADGLQACTDAEIALTTLGPGACPPASQIASVQITTPLLPEPLAGALFVGTPTCSPCTSSDAENGNLFRLFLQAQGSGVTVKLAGTVSANPTTGQLTTTFANNPQLPFSDLSVKLKGGPRAPLTNPQTCGEAAATADLTPWTAPATPDATPVSPLTLDFDGSGPPPPGTPLTGGASCPGSLPLAPGFAAAGQYTNAGAFSPFTVSFSRRDREQDLSQITLRTPRGLLGMLSSVPLCGEPQAEEGKCPAAAQIGTTTVGAGSGSHPFYVSGPVYLTGPYKGAPFGLSVAVPAVAGPFNLGTVVVRAQIRVDPSTSQIVVASDPLPQILDGVPLRIQTVTVTVDRPRFIFNPTNCTDQAVGATITGLQGANAPVSSAFDVGGCQGLPFKPSFTASVAASTSKLSGSALSVRIVATGGQANIARVDLQLPKQLPSRLTTLQKACLAAQFEINPADCPPGSVIGYAKAVTPVLNVPLSGPAILVSHGGAAFPDVEFVLQGQGVTVVLDGATQIKNGITYSHFDTLPDAPITSFDTVLPQGPHSILGSFLPVRANHSFCGQQLTMPTTITGQNGAEIKQNTPVTVTGCPKVHKAKKRKSKHRKKHHGKGKRK